MTRTFSLPRIYYYIWQKRRDFTIDWFRNYEKNNRKLCKLKLDITFIQSCLDLNIFPTFVNFRVPHALRNLDSRQIKKKILRCELKDKQRSYNNLTNLVDRDKEKISINKVLVLMSLSFYIHVIPHSSPFVWSSTDSICLRVVFCVAIFVALAVSFLVVHYCYPHLLLPLIVYLCTLLSVHYYCLK